MKSLSNMSESVHDTLLLSVQWEDGWIHVTIGVFDNGWVEDAEYWITLCPRSEAGALRDWDASAESAHRELIAAQSFP